MISSKMAEPRKEKNLVLKTTEKLEIDDDGMDLLTRRFQCIIRKNGLLKKGCTSKAKAPQKSNNDGCYKCCSHDHLMRDFPMWDTEWKKNNPNKVKEQKNNRVPGSKMTKKKQIRF